MVNEWGYNKFKYEILGDQGVFVKIYISIREFEKKKKDLLRDYLLGELHYLRHSIPSNSLALPIVLIEDWS